MAWTRAIIEAIVEPKQASGPGEILPRAQAVCVGLLPVVCSPPLLICRTYLVGGKYSKECVALVKTYLENYRRAETDQRVSGHTFVCARAGKIKICSCTGVVYLQKRTNKQNMR